MSLVPLENYPSDGKDFADRHRLEFGHILPPTDKTFKEYFPPDQSFLLRSNKRVSGLFSYRTGRDKQTPTAVFRALADSAATLKRLVEEVEAAAVAGEKIIVRTSVFGYDSKKLQTLKQLGYKTGASLPGDSILQWKEIRLPHSLQEPHGAIRVYSREELCETRALPNHRNREGERPQTKSPRLSQRGQADT